MTRVLLVTSGWTPRAGRIAELVGASGQPAVVVAPRGAGRSPATGALQQVELEPHQYEGGHALAAVAYDFESELVLAVGWMAALAIGMLPVDLPNWIDVEESPLAAAGRSPACFDGGSEVGFWFRWVWSLDRVDRLSAGDSAVRSELLTLLASRGRIRGRSTVADVVLLPTTPAPDDGSGALRDWLREPRRDGDPLRTSGRREIGLAAEVERLRGIDRAGSRHPNPLARGLARATELSGDGLRAAAARFAVAWSELGDRLRQGKRRGATPAIAPPTVPARRRPRLLIVMPYPVFPPRHGGAVRLANLTRRLAREVDLSLFVYVRSRFDEEHARALAGCCRRVETFHWRPASPESRFELLPPNVRLFQSHQVAQRIRTLVAEEAIDVVQLEYTELGGYLGACGDAKTILVEHDIAYRTHQRRLELAFASRFSGGASYASSKWDLRRVRRFEHRALRRADQLHAMSDADAAFLHRVEPDTAAKLRVVPNGVDVPGYAEPAGNERRREVLIVGNFENLPNLDGWEYFHSAIWPLVLAARPRTTLTVAGAKLPEAVKSALTGPGLEAHSDVPDLRPYYWNHRLLAVPLRAGSGTRLKILEAAAAGIPVVSTTLGAEGLPLEDGQHLRIADSPETFAAAIVATLADAEGADARAREALAITAREFDWSAIATRNLAAVRELVDERAPDERISAGSSPAAASLAIVVAGLDGEGRALVRTVESLVSAGVPPGADLVLVAGGLAASELEAIAAKAGRALAVSGEPGSNLGFLFDAGARATAAEKILFVRAGMVVESAGWVAPLLTPLARACPPGAVFGELAAPRARSRAERSWAEEFGGVALDPDLIAMARTSWQRLPFGWARRMPEKWFQERAWEAAFSIETVAVPGTRFELDRRGARGLWREARIEGEEWRELGRRYGLRSMFVDAFGPTRGTRLAAIARSLARWRGARSRPFWERSW